MTLDEVKTIVFDCRYLIGWDILVKLDNGVWQDVYKNPVGDPGKRSKKGRFVVTFGLHDGWQTLPLNSGHDWEDMLQVVWRDGVLFRDMSFQQIRQISNLQFY